MTLQEQEYLTSDVIFKSMEPATVQMDAADLLVAYLEQIGVEYIFGVPGGGDRTVVQRARA